MLVEELVNLTPSAMMEFFELNVRDLPGFDENDPFDFEVGLPLEDVGIYRFYNWGMNELDAAVTWKGKIYQPYPIDISGFSLEGEKQIPRPVLSISNLLPVAQELVNKYDDILGGKVTRKRTFARFLDPINFISGVNSEFDINNIVELPDTIYYIRKKNSEDIATIVFELSSPWDVEGVKLPRRIMNADVCPWKYRGVECGHTGVIFYDIKNEKTDAAGDICSKHLDSCLIRFTNGVPIPFGGFPALTHD